MWANSKVIHKESEVRRVTDETRVDGARGDDTNG